MKRFILPALHAAIRSLGIVDDIPIALDAPRHREHGDLSTGIALELVPLLDMPSIEIAERIVAELKPDPRFISTVNVDAPGFINIRLTPAAFHHLITEYQHNELSGASCRPAAYDPDSVSDTATMMKLGMVRRAFARITAIERFAESAGRAAVDDPLPSWPDLLVEPLELEMIRAIVRLPASLEQGGRTANARPLIVALHGVAVATHHALDTLRIVAAEAPLRDARLRLLASAKRGMAAGMGALGLTLSDRL